MFMRLRKKNVRNKTREMLFLLVTLFTLSLTIGYAALNEDLTISGEVEFKVEKDIRITNISLQEIENGAIENYNAKYSTSTITMGTSLPEINSTITYNVTVTNSGTVSQMIDSISVVSNNNSNVEYQISGYTLKGLISPSEVKTFTVTLKYKSGVTAVPVNTNVDEVLGFNFVVPTSTLAQGNSGDATSTFFNSGPIQKGEVESIEFLPTLDIGEDAIGYWDASKNIDGTVIAW